MEQVLQAVVLPAHAGMIPNDPVLFVTPRCAPRTCGDDPSQQLSNTLATNVLPAHAGMIPDLPQYLNHIESAPRTCGDDPGILQFLTCLAQCSPHMRG